jgi:glycosyltransferase involved in cell wall biosynthesis
VEQTIAPARVEARLLREEREAFPMWEEHRDDPGAELLATREEEEWALADMILCGSDFVRQGVMERSGPVERSVVVPYGVEMPASPPLNRDRGEVLKVLTVGTVGLRKGIPYLMNAARLLKGRARFRVVGPIGISTKATEQLRSHVEVVGPVPRGDVAKHYQWADVFLLPSICEGSATVVYEALGHGLPAIVTPNTGSVVRDSADGFVVPLRDSLSIVARIERLAADRSFLDHCSNEAYRRAQDYDLRSYEVRLRRALSI